MATNKYNQSEGRKDCCHVSDCPYGFLCAQKEVTLSDSLPKGYNVRKRKHGDCLMQRTKLFSAILGRLIYILVTSMVILLTGGWSAFFDIRHRKLPAVT